MDLKEIRDEIDSIDNDIVELFKRRMDCSKKVAQYKMENGMQIFNSERENQVLDKAAEKAGSYGESARLLYSSIMELSRALQHDMIGSGTKLKNMILSAEKSVPYNDSNIKVACFGVEGTYAHKAAKKIFPNCEPVFHSPFRSVFEAVSSGDADFGVIPIENSSAGAVTAVYDLMLLYRFYIASAIDIKVEHCLAVKGDAQFSDIKTIYSHEQALYQCSDFFNGNKHITSKTFVSTAAAAKMIAESDDNSAAAVCSEEAAEKYGLKIIKRGFQNNPNNTTRFIVISRKMYIEPEAGKISLCFALPHVTGSLYSTLCRFAAHGLNLTKIESRPRHGKPFEYMFYLDFSGTTSDRDTLNMLCALSDELVDFSFLGNYIEFT